MTEVAVITGGASGFGLALGGECAGRGMHVALLDLDVERAESEGAMPSPNLTASTALGLGVDVGGRGLRSRRPPPPSTNVRPLSISSSPTSAYSCSARSIGSPTTSGGGSSTSTSSAPHVSLARSSRCCGGPSVATSRSPRRRRCSIPPAGWRAYQASKFAVWGLAETLRLELADDGISVSVLFPSGMISRHLETSGAAQPDHLRRPIATDDDLAAMSREQPEHGDGARRPRGAACRVLDALLDGEPYIITHGDLVEAVASRSAKLHRAAAVAVRAVGRLSETARCAAHPMTGRHGGATTQGILTNHQSEPILVGLWGSMRSFQVGEHSRPGTGRHRPSAPTN